MLLILIAAALTSVCGALFMASLGRARLSHVVVIGCMAAVSLMCLIASIAGMTS